MAKKQLGKYDIIERLGRGGMAEVYKAYQPSLDRFVAIKLLHPFLADDPEFKDRFEREARNVARLRHPNIVQVYDFEYDQDSESYYMVMELIDGLTLKDRMTQLGDQLLPIDETLRILRGATEALAYAHARGMIHRDVKPANLMLDSDGRVVLTDFGIAKIVTGIQFTASGGMVGTPAYMAPEQGLGEAGDERSDLYSLGVILFQMVTGKLPYEAETPLAVILKHLNDPLPSPRDFNPEVPPEVEKIISMAMDKDPEARFQNAEQMVQQINAAAGVKVYDTGPILVTPSQAMRSPGAVEGEGSAGAGAAGGSGGSDGGSHDTAAGRSAQGPESPNLATSTAVRRPANRSLAGLGAVAVVALLGWFVLTTLATGKTPFLAIVIRPTDTPTVTPSPQPSATSTNTPTEQATSTPTNVPSNTPTDTPQPTSTSTPTDTPLPTATFTPSITDTPTDTLTPTPNLTQTIAAGTAVAQNATATSVQATLNAFFLTQQSQTTPTIDYTATMALCIKEYRQIVDKQPQQDPIRVDTEFTRQIVLKNTSNCDWLPGMYLKYSSGERFGAPQTITMQNLQPVKPGENATFNFQGHTPKRGGLYSGVWEVRLTGDVLIAQPLTISFFAYE